MTPSQNGTSGRHPDMPTGPWLSTEDQHHLVMLDAKQQMVRDRVTAVAKGYITGLYLHGEGGVGKSFTVLQELQRLRVDFVVFNSRMTGRGLFDQLAKFSSSVHVLEDMEALFQDKGAQGVLRSALWAQRRPGTSGPLERPVTWTTHTTDVEFLFTGGIIVIANRPIDDVPELRAVKTRIACLHLEATVHELRALMRQIAGQGYDHGGIRLEPMACLEVCEFLIEQAASLRRSLDIRLLINGFCDRLQWEESDAACHWKDLVAARVWEMPTPLQNSARQTREGMKQAERKIVAEIIATTDDRQERLRLWEERTDKKSRAAFDRRLHELKSKKGEKVRK